jgi:hypothetical protein
VAGEALARAQDSLASALGVAGRLGGAEGERLADAAREAFVGGLSASLWAGAVILAVTAIGVALLVPGGRRDDRSQYASPQRLRRRHPSRTSASSKWVISS